MAASRNRRLVTTRRITPGAGPQLTFMTVWVQEFKHQNISAALDAIGLPWIPGYKPAVNYQGAIFDSIDRYLTQHPAIFEAVPVAPPAAIQASTVFIDAPSLAAQTVPVPDRLRSL